MFRPDPQTLGCSGALLRRVLGAALVIPLISGCSIYELEVVTEQLATEFYEQVVEDKILTVAVSDFITGDEISELGRDAANYFVGHLTRIGGDNVRVYDRKFLTQELEEHKFQWSNYAKNWDQLPRYGDKAPAAILVVGTIEAGSTYYDLRLRALDLRKGRVLMAASRQFIKSNTNGQRFAMREPIPAIGDAQPRFPDEPARHVLGRAADELARSLIEDLKQYPELRLATNPLSGPNHQGETEFGRVLLQMLEANLRKYGAKMTLRLMSRRNLKDVLNMQMAEQGAFFDEDTVAPIDQAEGAQAILQGEITQVEGGCNVHVAVISLSSKVHIASANATIPPASGQEDMFSPVQKRDGKGN